MIILIGGVGYAGKTLMAQTLLERYRIPYLSIDHLKMGLYRAGADCGFTPLSPAEVIGDRLWPILKGIIMTNIENRQSLILEGCYLFPQKIRELEPAYLENTISFYLGFSPEYIERCFDSNILRHRCAIEARGDENSDTVEEYLIENQRQKEICERYGATYFEINENYEEETARVYAWIDGEAARIKRRIMLDIDMTT